MYTEELSKSDNWLIRGMGVSQMVNKVHSVGCDLGHNIEHPDKETREEWAVSLYSEMGSNVCESSFGKNANVTHPFGAYFILNKCTCSCHS